MEQVAYNKQSYFRAYFLICLTRYQPLACVVYFNFLVHIRCEFGSLSVPWKELIDFDELLYNISRIV